MRVAAQVHGCAGWSHMRTRSDSAALPRVDSTSQKRKYSGRGWQPGIFKPSWRKPHIRRCRPCGPVAGARCLRRSDPLPVQRAQPSACHALAGNLERDGARHVGTLHNDGPSNWQHANGLCRLDRESSPIETGSSQEPMRDRPQRRPAYCIQLSPVYRGRIAKLFRRRFRYRGSARPRPLSQPVHAGFPVEIRSLRQAMASLPISWSGSRKRMPHARNSWIAPPISCWWRAACGPRRLSPVLLYRLSSATFV